MNQRREFLKFLAASPLLTNYNAFAQEVEEFKIANRLAAELLTDKHSKILLEQQINDLKNSWSWRMTAPMRKIVGIIKK